MKIIFRLLFFVLIIAVVQHMFIAYVPNIIFAIAQFRKPQAENTVIHALSTNAKMRKVVLPNPDFIYSACFYNVSNNDLVISGEFPDSSQYCSVAIYDNTTLPFYVSNNLSNQVKDFKLRLSKSKNSASDIVAKTKRGVILMRVLATDENQINNAKRIQQLFKVNLIDKM